MKSPPPHIQAAARALSDWMAQEGHEDWMLNGCASAKTVIRLEREVEEAHLKRKGITERLTDLLRYMIR